ncbi:hypothetical protein [Williamsia muralis]|uniref:hypothetical protein n=1 Tax=Williamsia marianensis TaxID=85044 RepID=UPI000DE6FD3F|nr:hypothetical protein [Williamsia marianensis]PVY29913.1 hypothetical protein C7458_105157 [Williamsia marianensis]
MKTNTATVGDVQTAMRELLMKYSGLRGSATDRLPRELGSKLTEVAATINRQMDWDAVDKALRTIVDLDYWMWQDHAFDDWEIGRLLEVRKRLIDHGHAFEYRLKELGHEAV